MHREPESGPYLPAMEELEERQMLSRASLLSELLRRNRTNNAGTNSFWHFAPSAPQAYTQYQVARPNNGWMFFNATGSSSPKGKTPTQIRSAYGVNNISFGTTPGDGSGQTIAIVDAYDDPSFVDSTSSNFDISDLHRFDQQFGLPDPPSFTKVNQSGGTNYPYQNTGWDGEIALDVEWSHVIAPKAKIVLVEANSSSMSDLDSAVRYASTIPGVVAVSMSYGSSESRGETSYDSLFTTPSGHNGITFVASTGDSGSPGEYQAYSPNVLAVGGTSLTLNSSGGYGSEKAWSGSGGGISQYELKPPYQSLLSTPSSTMRTTPDVSMDADPNTGVAVFDTSATGIGSSNGWVNGYVGGTSLAAPMWSGLIAIADQGRSLAGLGSLDGPTQTLPDIYSLPSTDFHDITSGSNGGFSATTGYDAVTGRGSPVANLLVPALAQTLTVNSPTLTLQTNAAGTSDEIFTNATGTGAPAYTFANSSLAALHLLGSTSLTVNLANGNPLSGVNVSYSGKALDLNGSSASDTVSFSSKAITVGSNSLPISGVKQVSFDGAGGLDKVSINSGPTVDFTSDQQLQSLLMAAGTSAKLDAGNLTLYTNNLSLATGATLDLTDGTLIDNATTSDLPNITSDLTTGYNSDHWNGTGIDSSLASSNGYALGYAQASDLGLSPFGGVSIHPTAVIVKYTRAGDANLDGTVNDADLTLMKAQQALGKRTWSAGNFNYDNAITADDWMTFAVALAKG